MSKERIEHIRYYSQELGLFDGEIAEKLDVARATVNRIRIKHNIPSPNLNNRVDKKQCCKRCGKVEYIARSRRKKPYCKACKKHTIDVQRTKRREYMREYDKNKKHSAGMLQSGT